MPSLAQLLLDQKQDMPTALSSQELRQVDAGILRQSLFSARMVNADAVQGVRDALTDMLTSAKGASTDNLAEARLKLKKLGAALGYDPAAGGFPGMESPETTAEPGTIKDLFSTDRVNLILKTIQQQLQGAAKNIWGNEPAALEEYPAWELVRLEARDLPRGLIRRGKGVIPVPEDAWDTDNGRWQAACAAAGDDEALRIFESSGRMVARKDSDVWQALGDGAGGYDDTLGNDYEPYAFNSGMGRVEVSADDFAALGGDPDDVGPAPTEVGPTQVNVSKSRFDPDVLGALKKALDSGDLKFRVKVTSS